jgi:hypothetical protein
MSGCDGFVAGGASRSDIATICAQLGKSPHIAVIKNDAIRGMAKLFSYQLPWDSLKSVVTSHADQFASFVSHRSRPRNGRGL